MHRKTKLTIYVFGLTDENLTKYLFTRELETFISEKRVKNTKLRDIATNKTYYVIPQSCLWCKS